MDIVITYVNQDDIDWQLQLKTHNPTFDLSKSYRFKDYGTLPFLFRGIEKNMPFINNVFLVVASESQVPTWLNTSTVRVVYHKDIIPEKFLPTFNSCTIEMFLHNIPDLDEEFVYFNDDMFPVNPLVPDDFFKDGKVVTRIKEEPKSVEKMFHIQLYNTTQAACKLANVTKNDIQFRAEHSCTSMKKSVNKLVYDALQNEIDSSITQFRSSANITQYLSLYYNYLMQEYVARNTPILKYFNTRDKNLLDNIIATPKKIICLNDNGAPDDNWDINIKNTFSKLLPKISKYEKMEKIDYVIPFVDFSDDIWYNIYAQHVDNKKGWANNATRYRDWNILKYQLRSIETYMPWINNIYIVVSITPTQVPKWLNTDNPKIHVVMDYDIVPKELLPTFNSNTIDLFIPRIKGLADKYIYACDDYVITKPLHPYDFYTNEGKVRQYISIYYMNPLHPYTKTILNSNDFVKHVDELRDKTINELHIKSRPDKILGYKTNHGQVAHLTKENLKFLEKNYNRILDTITEFRSDKNITWIVYSLNLIINQKLVKDKHIKVQKNNVKTLDNLKKIDLQSYDVVVINDDYTDDFNEGYEIVNAMLIKKFPNKSEFEK